MLILAIDTSTNVLSLALVRDKEVLATVNEKTKNNQSEILMSRIETITKESDLKPADLEKIIVAEGPGSYTGIRVGVAAAKSLGYALDIPVVGVSSLEVMAMASVPYGIRIPMIDARRETVFAGAYDHDGTTIIPNGHYKIEKVINKLASTSFRSDVISFIGDGAVFHKKTLREKWPEAQVVSESEFQRNKAEVLAALAVGRPAQQNIHILVPNYLRRTEAEMNASV